MIYTLAIVVVCCVFAFLVGGKHVLLIRRIKYLENRLEQTEAALRLQKKITDEWEKTETTFEGSDDV